MANDYTTDFFPDDWWPPGWFPDWIPPDLIDFKDFVVEARIAIVSGVGGMDEISLTMHATRELKITVHADRSDRDFAVHGHPTYTRDAAVVQDKAVAVEM